MMYLPPHVKGQFGGTIRSFKKIKRREVRLLEEAFRQFWLASAYLPDGCRDATHQMLKDIRTLRQMTSEREWGR